MPELSCQDAELLEELIQEEIAERREINSSLISLIIAKAKDIVKDYCEPDVPLPDCTLRQIVRDVIKDLAPREQAQNPKKLPVAGTGRQRRSRGWGLGNEDAAQNWA